MASFTVNTKFNVDDIVYYVEDVNDYDITYAVAVHTHIE